MFGSEPGRDRSPGGGRHIVLASAEGVGFASLRRPATPRPERYAVGRALRQQVPRPELARWDAPRYPDGPGAEAAVGLHLR
jgi:hypothetical protein